MTLQQLSIFLIVAEEQNFTRAAERLFISQPTVSREIMALEEELQCTLFTRSRRIMKLTEAGKRILPGVKTIVETSHSLKSLARGNGVPVNGCVRIGYVAYGQTDPFMKRLGKFFEENAELELETFFDTTPAALESFRRRKTDIVLIPRVTVPDRHGPVFVLERSCLCVMAYRGDALFTRKSIRIEELRDKPIVTVDPCLAEDYCNACNETCERAGFTPKIVGTGKSLEEIKIQMQLKNAVSFASKAWTSLCGDDYRVIPVIGDYPEFDNVAVAQRKPACECAEVLVRALQEGCESLNRTELGDGI